MSAGGAGTPTCHFCGEQANPLTLYREVRGWVKDRQQGGANQITLRQETGRVACMTCEKQKRGVATGQQSLG